MRTKIRLLFALFLIPLAGIAQETTMTTDSPEQAKKTIKRIKLSEEYVYAEATTPISIADAQRNSKDLLQIYITGILTGQLDMKKKEVDKKWETMEEQCHNIVVKNGDLYKVCTYIGKEMVFPDWKKKEAEAQIAKVSLPSETSEQKQTALSAIPDKGRSVISELLEMKTFNELITCLEKGKNEGYLTYGSIKNATSLNTSYLIIFKKENPVMVLGPGTDQRTNYRTDLPDSIMKYVGYSIIWFQLF